MKAKGKGLFFTVAVVLLIIPLILFVAYYATFEKTKRDDTINKIRCDELHYFVEDIKSDLQRAMVIFGRRAAIYAIDDVVSSGVPLRDYAFECSSSCHLDCNEFTFDVNGSEAAMAELILCGTLHGDNITYMVNHTLSQWLGRIEDQGSDMHFNVSIDLLNLNVVMKDPWTFVMFVNTSFNVFDESRTCFYVGSNVATISSTSVLGLEDPLYPLNTRSFVIKYINNCTMDSNPWLVTGCSTENLGNGSTTGYAVMYSDIAGGDRATYCSDNYPDVNNQIFIMDTDFGTSPCATMQQCCFNLSCPNHFAGAVNYDKNRAGTFVDDCQMTVPWITGTGDMDYPGAADPSWSRPPGCNDALFTAGDCIEIRNNEACSQHQVLMGKASNMMNTTCYQVSNTSLYGGLDGPSFFDRLEGNLNLSEVYRNQSLQYFNNSFIGMETLIDPYYIEAHGILVYGNRSWVDYLYWGGGYGCEVHGLCPYGKFRFRLDDEHAKRNEVDTLCLNVTGCPGSTEVCVNGVDEDSDGYPDWLDFDCIPWFTGCGEIQACDFGDTDDCATCGNPTPPLLSEGAKVSCDHYGYNTSEWHFYRVVPSGWGRLSIVFNGTSNGSVDEKTDLIIYNYSIDGGLCNDPEVRLNMESDSLQQYCVQKGEIYVLGLDVDAPRYGYNGSYQLGVYLDPGNPACPTPSTSTSPTSTTSTSSSTPATCGFFDDMDAGVGGWTHGGPQDEWEHGIPDWGSAYSGFDCWATDLAPVPWDVYENNADQWLMSPEIDLSSATSATLYFYGKYRTENSQDYCYVEASPDAVAWNPLATYTDTQNTWLQYSYPLDAYAGGSVWVRFSLVSDWLITREGLYVDDVNVTCS